jgi:hypothetical protein
MDAVLPGEDLIEAGLHEGRETAAALLVAIGSPRLTIGFYIAGSLACKP